MDWQQRYLSGDTPWDKGRAAPALKPFVEYCSQGYSLANKVLVPGCGSGHDAAALAELGYDVRGWDIAPAAIEAATKIYAKKSNLQFQEVDIFEPLEAVEFGWVWEHTCFCAIDPSLRRPYMEALAGLLQTGGYLLGIFFLNPDVEPGEGPPFGATVEEICEVAEGLFELVHEVEPRESFCDRVGRERMLLFRKVC